MMMKTLIVYYSLEGNTDYAARRIAEQTGAETLRLIPKKAYPDKGFRKFLWGGRSAVMAEQPGLEPYDVNWEAYDRIVFGFPVWASRFAPPIRTFILENTGRLKGMRMAAFACQGGSGAEKALEKLRRDLAVDAFDAEMILNDPMKRPSEQNEARIRDFCGRLSR